jgi:hypothetical protein
VRLDVILSLTGTQHNTLPQAAGGSCAALVLFKAVDVKYKAPWPVGVVLSKPTLDAYAAVHRYGQRHAAHDEGHALC